jgi:hypothetical protein
MISFILPEIVRSRKLTELKNSLNPTRLLGTFDTYEAGGLSKFRPSFIVMTQSSEKLYI